MRTIVTDNDQSQWNDAPHYFAKAKVHAIYPDPSVPNRRELLCTYLAFTMIVKFVICFIRRNDF